MTRERSLGGGRRTPLDLAWPDREVTYVDLAGRWGRDAFDEMLEAVWKGYDDLFTDVIRNLDITQADDELERAITQILEPRIRRCLSGDEPWDVQHGPYEYATRKPSPAQPPQYDIAFVLRRNPRIMWPLEAKILRNDGAIAPYVRDVQQEFLTGRYAPYVNGSAMLAYLLRGRPETVFRGISDRLACRLQPLRKFDAVRHRVSVHQREIENPDFLSGTFWCHHLVMKM